MRILEPTLIRSPAGISVSAAGATSELDFDFGSLEGAKLLAVEYNLVPGSFVTGVVEMGLNFNGSAAAPTTSQQLADDENVFALQMLGIITVTAVGVNVTVTQRVDLTTLDLFILSNIALQGFNTGAVARLIGVKVYFKRVLFTQDELGSQLAVRR